jgi:hypothetical protein
MSHVLPSSKIENKIKIGNNNMDKNKDNYKNSKYKNSNIKIE